MGRQHSDKISRGRPIAITVDGSAVTAHAGETLAAVLLAEDTLAFNRTQHGERRGPYCNMGACFECQVQVSQSGSSTLRWLRACVTPATDGMTVRTGERPHTLERQADAD